MSTELRTVLQLESPSDEVVDISDSDSDNSDNDDDPYQAADPDAADPEDSVEITGVDEQEFEHAGVVKG